MKGRLLCTSYRSMFQLLMFNNVFHVDLHRAQQNYIYCLQSKRSRSESIALEPLSISESSYFSSEFPVQTAQQSFSF